MSPRATPLASFNELARLAELHGAAGEGDEENLRAALLALEAELDEMSAAFHTECLFRVDDDELLQPIEQVYQHYHGLFAAVSDFREAFVADASTGPSLDRAAQHLNEIFVLYGTMREHAEKQPRESESIHLAELIRVARACQAERLPWDAFAARLDTYYANYLAFVDAFELQDSQGGAWGLSQAQRETTISALQRVNDSLSELAEDLNNDAIEALKTATSDLLAVHHHVRAELEKPTPPFCCPRCGAENSRRDRVCTACHATLPRPVEEDTAVLDVHTERSGLAVPAQVAELGQRLADFLAGNTDKVAFQDAVSRMRDAAHRVETQLETLPGPPAGAPEDLTAYLKQGKTLLQQGQTAFATVLDAMLEHCREGSFDQLQSDYDALVAAAEPLVQLSAVAAQLQARATTSTS